jgi:ribosomal protein L3
MKAKGFEGGILHHNQNRVDRERSDSHRRLVSASSVRPRHVGRSRPAIHSATKQRSAAVPELLRSFARALDSI